MKTCKHCEETVLSRGLCSRHYFAERRAGVHTDKAYKTIRVLDTDSGREYPSMGHAAEADGVTVSLISHGVKRPSSKWFLLEKLRPSRLANA